MLDNVLAHHVAQRIGIPAAAAEDRLLAPRPRIASRLRPHPPRLAPLRPQKPFQEQRRRQGQAFLREQGAQQALGFLKR